MSAVLTDENPTTAAEFNERCAQSYLLWLGNQVFSDTDSQAHLLSSNAH